MSETQQQQPQEQQPQEPADTELPPNTSPQTPSCIWPQLLPELEKHIISFLPPNEVACTVRLINKAAAAQFRGPGYTTVKLSSHVPPHAFKEQWERPGAMRGLTHRQRQALQMLTARSGSLPNLQVAVAVTGIPYRKWCVGYTSVAHAAAEAGQLEMCQWLVQQQGYPVHDVIEGAAGAGQWAICKWGLANGCPWSPDLVYAAARGGHVGLMEWLLQLCLAEGVNVWSKMLLETAAVGCELHTLQRLYCDWVGEQQTLLDLDAKDIVAAAARSSTPDWQDKLVWLEAQGFPGTDACWSAASCPDALERLRWLRGQGYPLGHCVAVVAARRGNVEVLHYLLLSEGIKPSSECGREAAGCGSLGALALLHAHGCQMNVETVGAAAREGHLHVVVWLVETLGAALQLGAEGLSSAAYSGNLELLRLLRERGCPWDRDTIRCAARSGCEEVLEWLVERGCPMPDNGYPYLEAVRNNDLATLAYLKQLGCPWGPPGRLLKDLLQYSRPCIAVLSWLLAAGYPMTAEAALEGMQRIFVLRDAGNFHVRRLWGWMQENLGLQPPQQDP
ncbi:hypothetical protein Agub_g1039 [Astrephomene gubernaculifera]|uniref:Ankyrin repeat domain-containing protein n=1 Tax=Astrephomene gubernaculifera TaxID=47775 RepID=A0AAD3HH72_9CHLO|nr:hypothetical protein Agub_g1039 [Astrephomene gubernaculifera]